MEGCYSVAGWSGVEWIGLDRVRVRRGEGRVDYAE